LLKLIHLLNKWAWDSVVAKALHY